MGKLTVLILVAVVAVCIVVALKGGNACPSNTYCPSGGPSVSTDGGHYTPPDQDPDPVIHVDL
jgi:hypothetical protein